MAENPTAMQLDFSTKRWLQRRLKNGVPTRHQKHFVTKGPTQLHRYGLDGMRWHRDDVG